MKKLLTVALAGCIVASGCFAFAGCSNPTDYEHTIVFYSSQGQDLAVVTDTAIENFQEKYPGWKVEHIKPGGYKELKEKVISDLQTNIQPDVAYCYADHVAQYLGSKTVVNMSQYFTNANSFTYTYTDDAGNNQTKTVDRIGFTQADVDSFIPGYLEEGYGRNYSGIEEAGFTADTLITLPFVKSTEALYYNPNALKELGEVDDAGNAKPPETWKDLWRICEKAKTKWPGCTPLGYDSEANWFITMSQQLEFGYTDVDPAHHFLFKNDGAKAWLNEIKGYFDKHYFTTQQIYGNYTSGLFTKGPNDGGLIFCIGSTGGAKNQSGGTLFTTEVAPIPQVDETHNQCISQGPSLVMLAGGHNITNLEEKQIMTFQFIKELLSVNFQAKFARASGYAPMRTDVYDNEDFQLFVDGKDEDGKPLTGTDLIISKCVKAGSGEEFNKRLFTSPAFVGSSTARDQMDFVVVYVLQGQKDPDRALSDAYKACGGK